MTCPKLLTRLRTTAGPGALPTSDLDAFPISREVFWEPQKALVLFLVFSSSSGSLLVRLWVLFDSRGSLTGNGPVKKSSRLDKEVAGNSKLDSIGPFNNKSSRVRIMGFLVVWAIPGGDRRDALSWGLGGKEPDDLAVDPSVPE